MTSPVNSSHFLPGNGTAAQMSEATPQSKFSNVLKTIGKVTLAAGKAAATFIPGASAISSFFDSVSGDQPWGQTAGMTPIDMLGIQQSMLQEAQMFTLVSNIVRIRHDAAMNAIRNIK